MLGPERPGTGPPFTGMQTRRSGGPFATLARDIDASPSSNIAVAIHRLGNATPTLRASVGVKTSPLRGSLKSVGRCCCAAPTSIPTLTEPTHPHHSPDAVASPFACAARIPPVRGAEMSALFGENSRRVTCQLCDRLHSAVASASRAAPTAFAALRRHKPPRHSEHLAR